MDRYILFSIYMLLSFMFGATVFFTFIIAPAVFSGMDSRQASFVMNLIFPYYFKVGWIAGIVIYTLIGIYTFLKKDAIKELKHILIALFFIVIINMALDRAVLPISKSILIEYYQLIDDANFKEAKLLKEKFDTLHTISSILNLIYLSILVYMLYLCFKLKGIWTNKT
ncbi:MAG: DUF4149 domain-containing protein [Hydrogenothermaceae bacterium]|nr:DUF4149 domain-containing protein [Hydrogenothermaceae bacterium]